MSNDSRIVYVKDIYEAFDLVDKEYSSLFPLPMRGIITSIGSAVDLFYLYRRMGKLSFTVKNIEDTLKDGTELDIKERKLKTRVAWYVGSRISPIGPLLIYANKAQIDEYNYTPTMKEKTVSLRPALLTYDITLLLDFNGDDLMDYNVSLPKNPEERAKAILKAYIIDENN